MIFWSGRCSPNGNPICKNNATCVIHPEGELSCDCLEEYEGERCQNSKFKTKFIELF